MQTKVPTARNTSLPQTDRQSEIPARYRWQRDDDRYYEAILQRDLFGWVVIRIWGRVGSRLGQVRTTPLAGYQDGLRLLGEIFRRRAARRYYLMTEFANAASDPMRSVQLCVVIAGIDVRPSDCRL